jgi:hypothetical protein
MPPKIHHITPSFSTENLDVDDTSSVEPVDEELSNSDWIEVEEREWSDEQLLDDARSGRRKGASDRITELGNMVNKRRN